MNATATICFRKSYVICLPQCCIPCTGVFDDHCNVLGHVIMTTDVNELLEKIAKHAKKLSPNNKPPVIKIKNGGNSLLSKSTVMHLKSHLEAEEISDSDVDDSDDDDFDGELTSEDDGSGSETEENEFPKVKKHTKHRDLRF